MEVNEIKSKRELFRLIIAGLVLRIVVWILPNTVRGHIITKSILNAYVLIDKLDNITERIEY